MLTSVVCALVSSFIAISAFFPRDPLHPEVGLVRRLWLRRAYLVPSVALIVLSGWKAAGDARDQQRMSAQLAGIAVGVDQLRAQVPSGVAAALGDVVGRLEAAARELRPVRGFGPRGGRPSTAPLAAADTAYWPAGCQAAAPDSVVRLDSMLTGGVGGGYWRYDTVVTRMPSRPGIRRAECALTVGQGVHIGPGRVPLTLADARGGGVDVLFGSARLALTSAPVNGAGSGGQGVAPGQCRVAYLGAGARGAHRLAVMCGAGRT